MKLFRWIWVLALLPGLVHAVWPSPGWADARALPPPAQAGPGFDQVLAALDRNDWSAVDGLTGAVGDPLEVKLLFWLAAARSDAPMNAAAIESFVDANPDWPLGAVLRRRAEEALPVTLSDAAVAAWFAQRQPSTPYGRYRLATALQALGQHKRAADLVQSSWSRGDDFAPEVDAALRAAFAAVLTPGDHRARLDALLWSGRYTAARRLYDAVGPGDRALAEARMRLRLQRGNVDAAVAAVPAALANDPGLVYERVRWRRRNGLEADARALLAGVKGDPGRPDLWWIERNALARDALHLGHVSEAYRLVRDHRLVEPGDYSEAEWLAGWIALRFLREPKAAQGHFLNMFKVVRFPISIARAAHWAARAGEAAGDPNFARTWDQTAAAHPTTFYGRLSAQRLGIDSLTLPPDAQPDARETVDFAGHELVRAVRLLAAHGRDDTIRTFIRAIADVRATPGWQAMTTALAAEVGGPSLGVTTAKRAMRNGYTLFAHAYPTMSLPDLHDGAPRPVDPALVLAMIRQESEFALSAVSPSGARGLMQLMPATAKHVAAKLDVDYSLGRLTSDAGYNLDLGQAYLSTLLDAFDGSYVLAFAAYNAGPGRVRQWLDVYGDPRRGDVDVIDWIELLPFEETRNYVQRAIENMWIYQSRLRGDDRLVATDF